ncbi:MAG: alginate lyase family protein [Candidatus Bathyarchaeota archaeon]|nr:alginate lyase family protein [Candidatus Bathyarchaeota archaeon]
MDIQKTRWLFNRLRAMSIQEVYWRLIQKSKKGSEKIAFKKFRYINEENLFLKSPLKNLNRSFDVNKFYNFDHSKKIKELSINTSKTADEILDNKLTILNKYNVSFDKEVNWFLGFNTDTNWPLDFSHEIDFRQTDHIGDVRFNWDLNRHYHFVILSKTYFITGKKKYLIEFKKQFYNWINENPFLYGVNWTSSMEIAIRAFSWTWCLAFINASGNNQELTLREDLEIGILNQVDYVKKHLSLYSSANNHLIVEAVVTGITGILFNDEHSITSSLDILEREIQNQVSIDGINKEQAIHYHAFVIEAVALLIILLRKNKIYYPNILDIKLEKMCEFIANIINIKGYVPNIGDSDEGCILNLKGAYYNYYEYILQLGNVLYNKKFTEFDNINDNLLWLFDTQMEGFGKYKRYNNSKSSIYKDGGYTLLKHKENSKERLLTFDHGQLGFKSLAAHGHADALSITLSIDGEQIFIDPGTYIYNIENYWRNYFRKTINHSTIEIDGKDQSEIKGAFLWGKKANAKVIKHFNTEKQDFICGSHDGYDPIKHERSILYIKPDLFIIEDSLYGSEYSWCLSYIIDENLDVTKINDTTIKMKSKLNTIYVYFLGIDKCNIEEAWNSKYFGEKHSTIAIRTRGENKGKANLITLISINREIKFSGSKNEIAYNYKGKNLYI